MDKVTGENGRGRGKGEITVGVGMVVRNGAETMGRALEPFVGLVDEVAILLGGRSTDETPRVAAEYATLPVKHYDGPLDEEGRFLDFAAARQQVFDWMTTDWAIVVDADEVWYGVREHLRALVADVDERGTAMVQFPYQVGRGVLLRPLLIRRGSGLWRYPVHEYWDVYDKTAAVAQTGLVRVEQAEGSGRPGHYVAIARAWLAENGPDARVLALLGRDLIEGGMYEEALGALNWYFTEYGNGDDAERRFEAHYCRAAAFLRLERYGDALQAGAMALTARPYGMAWAVMAEAALWMARATAAPALYELCVTCAEEAVRVGRARTAGWSSEEMVTTIPLLLKAQAVLALGRRQEALAALDLALAVDGGNGEAARLREEVCRMMGVLV